MHAFMGGLYSGAKRIDVSNKCEAVVIELVRCLHVIVIVKDK
jgi:hypothetical protein